MKRIFLILATALFAFNSCNSDDNSPQNDNNIIGKWKLVGTSFDGVAEMLDECDRKTMYEFSSSTFKFVPVSDTNGTCRIEGIDEGTYSINGNSITALETSTFLINGNTLTLSFINDDTDDGQEISVVETYEKTTDDFFIEDTVPVEITPSLIGKWKRLGRSENGVAEVLDDCKKNSTIEFTNTFFKNVPVIEFNGTCIIDGPSEENYTISNNSIIVNSVAAPFTINDNILTISFSEKTDDGIETSVVDTYERTADDFFMEETTLTESQLLGNWKIIEESSNNIIEPLSPCDEMSAIEFIEGLTFRQIFFRGSDSSDCQNGTFDETAYTIQGTTIIFTEDDENIISTVSITDDILELRTEFINENNSNDTEILRYMKTTDPFPLPEN